MQQANFVFLYTLGILFLGYSLKYRGLVTEKDGKVLSRLLMHSTFPSLVFLAVARARFDPSLFLLPLLPMLMGCLMLGVAWRWFAAFPSRLRGVMTMAVGGFNTGLFGFSIVEGIWGRDAMPYIILYDLGVTLLIFCLVYPVGRYFAMKDSAERIDYRAIFLKVIRLPPLQAMMLGLLFNLSGLPLPLPLAEFLDILAQANRPLVLMLMGIYLHFGLSRAQILLLGKVFLIRYTCGFLALMGCYACFPPSEFRSTLMICVILPVGLTLIPFSDEFDFDARLAAALVNISLVISFVLMWIVVLCVA